MKLQRQLHVRVSDEVFHKLKLKCVNEDTSLQEYVARLIVDSVGPLSPRESSVLIVEDEAIVRESLRDWLSDYYQIVTAETGEQALELIARQDFDIVLLDVRLPGMSGMRVLRHLKETRPGVDVIVVTAYPSVPLAVEAMKLGAVDYLVKPVVPNDLERLMKEILARREGRPVRTG